jgi:predicted ester cyclase
MLASIGRAPDVTMASRQNEFVQAARAPRPQALHMVQKLQQFLALGALLACAATEQPTPPARSPDMTDPTHTTNKQLIVSLYEECINTGALERLDELVAPDYVGPQGEQGPEGFRNTIRGLRAGIPDIQFTLDEVLAEGDGVAVRWTWRGTHSGRLREFAPSQKPVTNAGIALYHLKQGKIVHASVQTDRLGLLQQIGVLPPDLGALGRAR